MSGPIAARAIHLAGRASYGLIIGVVVALIALGLDFTLDNTAANHVSTLLYVLPALLPDLIALPLLVGARLVMRSARPADLFARLAGVRTRLMVALILMSLATAWCGLIFVSAAISALIGSLPPVVESVTLFSAVTALSAGQIYAALRDWATRQVTEIHVSSDGAWWWDGSAWQPTSVAFSTTRPK